MIICFWNLKASIDGNEQVKSQQVKQIYSTSTGKKNNQHEFWINEYKKNILSSKWTFIKLFLLKKKILSVKNVILAYDIGEQQIPAGDKSQQLTNSHVAVKVSRARFGNPGSKLRVAKSGKYRRQGSDEEGNDNAGSCGVSGHLSGEHIDPGSQGAAHAQGDQVQGG